MSWVGPGSTHRQHHERGVPGWPCLFQVALTAWSMALSQLQLTGWEWTLESGEESGGHREPIWSGIRGPGSNSCRRKSISHLDLRVNIVHTEQEVASPFQLGVS